MKHHTPAVRLVEIVARYGSVTALEANVDIPTGRVTALVGPNGSGKSTLLHVLAGVREVAVGRVRRGHSRRPALVPQHSAVPESFPMTVRRVVAMGRWAERGSWGRMRAPDRALVADAMRRLDITALAERRIGELSGGQRQRVLIAQGIAQRSDLLLLDEPAAGLDADSARRIGDLVRELADEGTTVVHATHDGAAAAEADHCLVLRDGRVARRGAPREVLDGRS